MPYRVCLRFLPILTRTSPSQPSKALHRCLPSNGHHVGPLTCNRHCLTLHGHFVWLFYALPTRSRGESCISWERTSLRTIYGLLQEFTRHSSTVLLSTCVFGELEVKHKVSASLKGARQRMGKALRVAERPNAIKTRTMRSISPSRRRIRHPRTSRTLNPAICLITSSHFIMNGKTSIKTKLRC